MISFSYLYLPPLQQKVILAKVGCPPIRTLDFVHSHEILGQAITREENN